MGISQASMRTFVLAFAAALLVGAVYASSEVEQLEGGGDASTKPSGGVVELTKKIKNLQGDISGIKEKGAAANEKAEAKSSEADPAEERRGEGQEGIHGKDQEGRGKDRGAHAKIRSGYRQVQQAQEYHGAHQHCLRHSRRPEVKSVVHQ